MVTESLTQLNEWKKLQGLLDRAAAFREACKAKTSRKRVNALTYKAWASMSIAERQPLFRDGSHVHVIAGSRDGERPAYPLRKIEDLKSLGWLDPKELRVVNGM